MSTTIFGTIRFSIYVHTYLRGRKLVHRVSHLLSFYLYTTLLGNHPRVSGICVNHVSRMLRDSTRLFDDRFWKISTNESTRHAEIFRDESLYGRVRINVRISETLVVSSPVLATYRDLNRARKLIASFLEKYFFYFMMLLRTRQFFDH